jgi:hypothetical protein
MSKLAWILLGTIILAVPTVASAHGSCGNNLTAKKACAIHPPAKLHGKLTTKKERDYYAFSASKGTKLRITITAGSCLGVTVACADVRATVYDSRHHEIGSTGVAEAQVQASTSYSHTLSKAGTYYIVVTGHLGEETPPFGGRSRLLPSAYTLVVKASPSV